MGVEDFELTKMLSTTNICRSFFTRIRLLFQKVHTMSSAPSMDRHAVTLVNALTRSLNPSSSPAAGDGDDMRVTVETDAPKIYDLALISNTTVMYMTTPFYILPCTFVYKLLV